ncbi:MAG: serine--tRNA ligase, partial [Thermoanaerobaculia bacterium]
GEIARLKKAKEDATAQIETMKAVGDEIRAFDERLGLIEEEMSTLELGFPNAPDGSVPVGRDESANREERVWGERPSFDFEPRAHWDIGD